MNTEYETITQQETITTTDTVRVKTVNEWIQEAKKRPIPKMLFGELWHEGELAILFGDTGHGKTVLATQIAESIATGRLFEPFEMNAEPQKVLLIDLEMSDKQFEMRYAEDHAGGKAKFLHKHYRFSRNFDRVEIDIDEVSNTSGAAFAENLRKVIEDIVAQRGSSVLILDNITFIKRSYYGARETLPMIKMLTLLKKRLGLSILVLAHTHRREFPKAIEITDLQESRLLGRYADSIFAIGPNRVEMSSYYLKHLKKRSNILFYTASHVPIFHLKKIGGNYLGLEFVGYSAEFDLLGDIRRTRGWDSIHAVKQRSDNGMSLSEIAADLGIPKTSVHRLLKMWRPPVDDGNALPTPVANDVTKSAFYFPGREEYDEAKRQAKFDELSNPYVDENTYEHRLLWREYCIIENACARANKAYKKTGVTPQLGDDPQYAEFTKAVEAGDNPIDAIPPPPNSGEQEHSQIDFAESELSESDLIDDTVKGLKRALNADGREIFIEEEDTIGRPAIWYAFDAQGNKMKFVRDCNGISVTR
ncbi:MAG: AAA family ATPase [Pyrinomonadaceae bacterium]